MRVNTIVGLSLVAMLCVVGGFQAARWLQSGGADEAVAVTRANGAQGGIPSIGGDWTLQSAHGPVSLSGDLRGKVVALYFGFASCPDVCPVDLNVLANAIRRLPADAQTHVQGVFVSLDPERDDPRKLSRYAQAFHPGMLGLTADIGTIKDVAWNYRAIFKKVPLPDSALGYTIDHSAITYIIGKNGVVQSLARHGDTADEIAEKIMRALKT